MKLTDAATRRAGPVADRHGRRLARHARVIDPAVASKLLLTPGERAEIVVDFSGYAGRTLVVLRNSGRAVSEGRPGGPAHQRPDPAVHASRTTVSGGV